MAAEELTAQETEVLVKDGKITPDLSAALMDLAPGSAQEIFGSLENAGLLTDAKAAYQEWIQEFEQNDLGRMSLDAGEAPRVVVCNAGKTEVLKPPDSLSTVTAAELDQLELEPPFFLVEGLLPTGLTILASPPKYGKSWLCLDLAISVASGTSFLGRKTNQCWTLYLALEDSESRLQQRMRKVLNGREPPSNFSMSTCAADLSHGLLMQLTEYLENRPETRLIIIDTFQRVRNGAQRNQNVYAADYQDTGELKAFADSNKLALVLVTHLRKLRDTSDDFMNITGTSGISGAADTMIVMSREKRSSNETKISATGRDIEMQEYQATFDKSNFRWRILGTSEELEKQREQDSYNGNPIVATVKKLLQQNPGGWTGTATEIISSSRFFRTEIYDSSRKLGREIERLQGSLYLKDGILYQRISNGSGGGKHKFWYRENPFEDDERE